MTLIDLDSGEPITIETFEPFSTPNSKISKSSVETGVRFEWIYNISGLLTTKIEIVTKTVKNIKDREEYFTRPNDAIGVIFHSSDEPSVVAC